MSDELIVRRLPAGERPPSLHPELDVFRPPAAQREALARIAAEPHGAVYVAERDGTTVAYLTFHLPDPLCAFGADRSGAVLELGAIEVAPSHRGERLAERLLQCAFGGGAFDATVVYATLFSWHYDRRRTGLESFAYKRLLERTYRKQGFRNAASSDPDVRADPANALMVRIGPEAPEPVVRAFHRLRTTPPDTLGVR